MSMFSTKEKTQKPKVMEINVVAKNKSSSAVSAFTGNVP